MGPYVSFSTNGVSKEQDDEKKCDHYVPTAQDPTCQHVACNRICCSLRTALRLSADRLQEQTDIQRLPAVALQVHQTIRGQLV